MIRKTVSVVGWVFAIFGVVVALIVHVANWMENTVIWTHTEWLTIAFASATIGFSMVLGALPADQGTHK